MGVTRYVHTCCRRMQNYMSDWQGSSTWNAVLHTYIALIHAVNITAHDIHLLTRARNDIDIMHQNRYDSLAAFTYVWFIKNHQSRRQQVRQEYHRQLL